jgi:hypothetical protein
MGHFLLGLINCFTVYAAYTAEINASLRNLPDLENRVHVDLVDAVRGFVSHFGDRKLRPVALRLAILLTVTWLPTP